MRFCGKRRQNTLQAVVRTLVVLCALKRHLVCLGEICTQGNQFTRAAIWLKTKHVFFLAETRYFYMQNTTCVV